MKNKFILTGVVVFLIFFVIALFVNSGVLNKDSEMIGDENLEVKDLDFEILAQNLVVPWAIDFVNGKVIFTERGGRISIIEDDEVIVVGEINVNDIGEGGLLGLAVDPDFVDNNFIYVYYTSENDNRVSRFVFDDKVNELASERVILEGIPFSSIHNGGRIKFGPDDKLYITTGDASSPKFSGDINSLAGKILRINKDGTIPEDNPFGNSVWSYGHRNPQGLAWNESGKMFSSEHGPLGKDEINIIEKGNDYGWPITCDEEGEHVNPIRCYDEFTLAPSGIEFNEDVLFVSGLRGSQLRKIVFDGESIVEEEVVFSEFGRIRDVVLDGDWIYIATSNGDGRGSLREGDDKVFRVRI
jgi:glucose/arabinose dehydrogenase